MKNFKYIFLDHFPIIFKIIIFITIGKRQKYKLSNERRKLKSSYNIHKIPLKPIVTFMEAIVRLYMKEKGYSVIHELS